MITMLRSAVFLSMFVLGVFAGAEVLSDEPPDAAPQTGAPSAAAASASSLPEGAGREALLRSCLGGCHDAGMLAHRYPPEKWVSTVDEMIGLGAEVADEDYVPVIVYLATHFAAEADEP